MKIFLVILLTYPTPALQNIEWEKIAIDDYVSLVFPINYERTDTLGQTIFISEGNYSSIILSVLPQEAVEHENINFRNDLESLSKMYDGVVTGFVKQFGNAIVNTKAKILVDSLSAIDFEVAIGTEEIRRVRSILIKDKMYLTQVIYYPEDAEEAQLEGDLLFNSLAFSINHKDQLMPIKPEDSQAYKLGKLFGAVAIYSIPLIILIVFLAKKKRKREF